jgi:hypothetical protein
MSDSEIDPVVGDTLYGAYHVLTTSLSVVIMRATEPGTLIHTLACGATIWRFLSLYRWVDTAWVLRSGGLSFPLSERC